MEKGKDGRLEGWKDGRGEGWKDGRVEGEVGFISYKWKIVGQNRWNPRGRTGQIPMEWMEGWKDGWFYLL